MKEITYEMRPRPQDMKGDTFRYAGGKWIPDDGEWDLAFGMPDDFMAYGISLSAHRNIEWRWLTQDWRGNEPLHPHGNPWHYSLAEGETSWGPLRTQNPNSIARDSAMHFVSGLKGCANGRGPEFDLNDPWMRGALARERDSKLIVIPPKHPVCMYCGLSWAQTGEP